jgi:serine/threonine-protein kinase
MVSQAANTQELAALNMDSLRRFGASPTSSGQLMALGVGSGSGSGVVAVEGHSGVSAAVAADEGKKKRGLVLLLLVLLVVFGVVGVLIFRFATVKEQPAASANPTGSAATPTATQPTATQTATAEPTATATHTATAPTAAVTETTTTATTPTTRPTTRHTGTFPTVPPRPTNTASATATASTAAPSATNPDENKGPGFLTLDTYPWTRVSEGGRVLGTTPLIRVPLSPGGHTLLLENPEQGIKQYYSVTIKSGENVSRRLGLK